MDLNDKLQQIPLFQALPADEALRLHAALPERRLEAGELLFREGDPSSTLCILVEGELEVIKSLGEPAERLLNILGPGEMLGEMSLFDPGGGRTASARALTPLRLLEIGRSDMQALLARRPELMMAVLATMGRRMRSSESAAIRDLLEKNRQLKQAYRDLQAAQARLIEKEKLEYELDLARRIQQAALPKELPDLPGWELAAHWQPARQVSGDYYDYVRYPNGRLALFIADVAGHGVPSALVMSNLRAVLRAAALPDRSPAQVLEIANAQICPDMTPGMFVTCFFAVLDPALGLLRFANAGHPLPLHHTRGEVCELYATGMPLGLLPASRYDDREAQIQPGDMLLFYTDGLSEAHDPARRMYGLDPVKAALRQSATCQALIERLLAGLVSFTAPAIEPEDDVTLFALRAL